MITIVPPAQVHELLPLIVQIPDSIGANALYMQHYAAGLLPVCRVAAMRWETILPVGYIMYEKGGRVNQIAVDKDARFKGVGLRLLNFAMARQTCTEQILHCRSDNLEALRFYKHVGFRPAGEVFDDQSGNEFLLLTRNKTGD